MKNLLILLFAFIIFLGYGCRKDKASGDFEVTIENNFNPKDYLSTGTTGLIKPGESATISFEAGIGQYLQFATMFVQSNDLFIAPDDAGIALFESRTAVTGDITDMLKLWDAGTEVNETPGEGPNQPPRQGSSDTGTDENGTVGLVNDNFSYPEISDVIKATLSYNGNNKFSLTLENISGGSSLPTPFAPGTWVIHSKGQYPMFEEGKAASPGLEALAEDGNITKMKDNLSSKSGFFSPFAPGAFSVATSNDIFSVGKSASSALEALAEDGDASGFSNVFNKPVGASGPGPLLPGKSYSFSFSAEEGQTLSAALMLVQSNDWFVGADKIDLFSDGIALDGDISSMFSLYDAGTEVDETPGVGNNQPLRQSGPNTGDDENGNVAKETSAGPNLPSSVKDYIKVTIRAK